MDARRHMLIANQKIITPDVISCHYDAATGKYAVRFQNGQVYRYNSGSIVWLKNPRLLEPSLYRITREGREFWDVRAIYLFSGAGARYFHICFENGTERDYPASELEVTKSCLDDDASRNVLAYLKEIAGFHDLKSEDGQALLRKQYEKLNYVGEDTALAVYLNPDVYRNRRTGEVVPIFPFGCNASQYRAVKAALENQLSVIEGPPGTGKTQTILNIIANLLLAGKTVQVVSNNNSATDNVLEKLSSPQYGMGFLVAPLGNSQNKAAFLKNQTGAYPDLTAWRQESINPSALRAEVQARSASLQAIFEKQERLALVRQELQALETEEKNFAAYFAEAAVEIDRLRLRRPLSSDKIQGVFFALQTASQNDKNDRSAAGRQKMPLSLRLKARFVYVIADWRFYDRDVAELLLIFQGLYYRLRRKELTREAEALQKELSQADAAGKLAELTELSMRLLKHCLYEKYGARFDRPVFSEKSFFSDYRAMQSEYPIVLSAAFSARSSLCKDATFDYLIMDEASQADVATGALALSCAKNAVVVGDTKQLPNVMPEELQKRTDEVFRAYRIPDGYNFARKSFLASVRGLLPDIPRTLLKEHYRCHPKIINFCNQKFYGGELVIMTEDHGEPDVLSVLKTVLGNHARGHLNQRQIDAICGEVLPRISAPPDKIGIIAPYNRQVAALKEAVRDRAADVATVHKFQGREKDVIILSTVDNEATDFSDDPYLLNVAVSRAKKQLCLVVSGNAQPEDSNIGDLISYIEYQNCVVAESSIRSVFDYLYVQNAKRRADYLRESPRVSGYESENLMYKLICDTLQKNGYRELGVAVNYPLCLLLADAGLLSDAERRYVRNPKTHVDFLIYNQIGKKAVLAVEVDGFRFHQAGTEQARRDKMKNRILDLYQIPYLRFATNGSGEEEKLRQALRGILR